jgi:hypothetical protein
MYGSHAIPTGFAMHFMFHLAVVSAYLRHNFQSKHFSQHHRLIVSTIAIVSSNFLASFWRELGGCHHAAVVVVVVVVKDPLCPRGGSYYSLSLMFSLSLLHGSGKVSSNFLASFYHSYFSVFPSFAHKDREIAIPVDIVRRPPSPPSSTGVAPTRPEPSLTIFSNSPCRCRRPSSTAAVVRRLPQRRCRGR